MAPLCFGDPADSLLDNDDDGGAIPETVRVFSSKTLQKATKGFEKLKAEHEFGDASRGVLEDGTRIAVLSRFPGIRYRNDFKHVIEILDGIRHRNVIRLIGCCVDGPVLMLVYEFMEHGSLASFLFGTGPCVLDWATRAAICVGVARGLAHLHEGISPRIVHLDIKPQNILLDGDFKPKIRSFELAQFIDDDVPLQNDGRICGTLGYIDPDFLQKGQFSEKSDVYSFGVVLLEVIRGRKNIVAIDLPHGTLVEQVLQLWESDALIDIIDPNLSLSEVDRDEVLKFIKVALFCIQLPWNRRPQMSQVLLMLSGAYDFIQRELEDAIPPCDCL